MKVVLTFTAVRDIKRLRDFLNVHAPEPAKSAVLQILAACEALCQFPNRGRQRSDGSRQLVVHFGASAYLVHYRVDEEEEQVVILRIKHAREFRR